MTDTTTTVQVNRLKPVWQVDVDDYISAMAVAPGSQTPDGQTLAVGTAEGVLHRLNAETGTPAYKTETLMPMSITQLAWTEYNVGSDQKAQKLAVSGQHNQVWVFQGENVIKKTVGQNWVEHIAWHPTEPWLLIGAERDVLVWDVERDDVLYTATAMAKNIMGLAWHPNLAKQFAVVCGDTLLRLDMTKPAPTRQFTWGAILFGLHWSPDAQVLATATHDNGLHIWYAKTGNDLHMSGYPGRITTMDWSPNSQHLATAGDNDVTIWAFSGKGPAGSMPVVLGAHQARVSQLAYCGTQLASADLAGQVFIWLPPENPDNADMEAPLWAYPAETAVTQMLYPLADVVYLGTEAGQCIRLDTP